MHAVAVGEVTGFYRVFHSYRYVGDQLVIRLMEALPEEKVKRLTEDFSDLIKAGGMRQGGALRQESYETELAELPRLVFRHERKDFGRLRQLFDAINRPETGDGG